MNIEVKCKDTKRSSPGLSASISRSEAKLKRCIDVVLLVICAPVVIPVMALLATAIKISSPGPVLFSQNRIGLGGRSFRMWKFRSMIVDADSLLSRYLDQNPAFKEEWEAGHKLTHDPRVTPIGRFLRASSLDELPQLWNVLVGDMSLVGPRPIVDSPTYDQRYIREFPEVFALYKSMRPGLTGLWQVSGRNLTTYARRIALDEVYITSWSFGSDFCILLRTLVVVINRRGAV